VGGGRESRIAPEEIRGRRGAVVPWRPERTPLEKSLAPEVRPSVAPAAGSGRGKVLMYECEGHAMRTNAKKNMKVHRECRATCADDQMVLPRGGRVLTSISSHPHQRRMGAEGAGPLALPEPALPEVLVVLGQPQQTVGHRLRDPRRAVGRPRTQGRGCGGEWLRPHTPTLTHTRTNAHTNAHGHTPLHQSTPVLAPNALQSVNPSIALNPRYRCRPGGSEAEPPPHSVTAPARLAATALRPRLVVPRRTPDPTSSGSRAGPGGGGRPRGSSSVALSRNCTVSQQKGAAPWLLWSIAVCGAARMSIEAFPGEI